MNILSTVISTIKEEGYRIIKVLCFGKDDARTADAVAPYGIDSNPIKDMSAIYAPTSDSEQTVILGYLNTSVLAEEGELRLYSTNSAGDLKAYVWLKKDGKLQLCGSAHNAVRYTPLNTGLQAFKTQIQTQLTAISGAIGSVGGTYAPGTLSVDISASKIEEIQTI